MNTQNTEQVESYSPAPWQIRENEPALGLNHYAVIAKNGDFVCSVTPMSMKRLRDEQNAKLIIAAPELLEACKEFVRKCDNGQAHSVESYKQMKRAIAMTV